MLNSTHQGLIALPVILTSRDQGLFNTLEQQSMTLSALETDFQVNTVALDVLLTIGWLRLDEYEKYGLTELATDYDKLSADLWQLFALDVETLLEHRQQHTLRHYLEQARQNWHINNVQLVEFLDNSLAQILLLALHAKHLLTPDKIVFNKFSPELRRELIRFFKQHHCLQQTELTQTGKTLVQSVLNHAPLLMACYDLLTNFISAGSKSLALNSFLLLKNAKTDGNLFLNSCQTLAQQAWNNDVLLQAAAQGLFPDKVLNPKQFVQRDYQIRPAQLSDLPVLVELETLCWAASLQKSSVVLEQRVRQYPNGQLVLVINGAVVGVIYSQRLSDVSAIYQHSTHDIESLHDEQGSIVQLLAVNVLPSMQQQNLGDQLLEFILQTCHLRSDVAKVVAVTLCKNYQQHTELSIADYIQTRNAQGSLLDPVLRFHELHGANIVGLVADYRPEDVNNEGYGVLVSYNLEQRQRTEVTAQSETKPLSHAELQTGLQNIIINYLGKQREAAFAFERPMMEMGLDSADLLAIQEKIVHQYQVPLKAAFFFQYNTPAKVLAYLAEHTCIITTAQTESITPTHTEPTNQHQDIAIVGMSCRLPKGINDPEQLWKVLSAGEHLIDDLPADRWQWSDDIDPVEKHRGIAKGGFLTNIQQFDAPFFRISPKEAEAMDPQQRLLLELAWHTLEHAGYAASSLTASNTGVFIGASGSDYNRLWDQAQLPVEAHCSTGGSMAVLANRLSYFFDFQGPSLLIDTACSSSLVAVHQAVEALQAGDCNQALVGGINILCHPTNSIAYYKAGMLAKDGLCKTFDQHADGYGRSEGAVMLLLKPLNAALADGDKIYALIKGSACNHGGQASGLTVPNPNQQAALLQKAWQAAHISPESLSYIEAHGTGTALGDPIEIQGLQTAWSQVATVSACGIGSIKTNLGHLEAAAGIAGLLKVVLCLQHRQLAASLHFKQLNSHIDLSDSPFYVVQSQQDWIPTQPNEPRRAGVSSFGSGGTNAHVIVEEFISPSVHNTPSAQQPLVFVLSAKNKTLLQHYAQQYLDWLNTHSDDTSIEDVVYSSQMTRQAMEQRLALVVNTIEELINQLQHYAQQGNAKYHYNIKNVGAFNAVINAETDVEQLAQSWATGGFSDWSFLYRELPIEQRPQRVTLPLYPFAKHSYWLPQKEVEPAQTTINAAIESDKTTVTPTALTAVWRTVVVNNEQPFTQNRTALLIIGGTPEQRHSPLYRHVHYLAVEATFDLDSLIQQFNALGEFEQLLWIVEDSTGYWQNDAMIAAQQHGVLALFNTLKALLALGHENKTLNWTVVTTQTQAVFPNEILCATHAGVHGLMGALAKEYPRWSCRVVDVARESDWLSQNLFQLPVEPIGETWAYRHQQWWQRSFIPVTPTTEQLPAYRQHGVYVVIGGAGGIGEAWSAYMIEQYQAQIIWLGRRAKDETIQAKLERLALLGTAPCYIQADASELSQLQRAYAEIKQTYPNIHGVIHAAVGLFDDSLAAMSAEHFRQVLSAKMDVSVHLSQVFSAEDLDFILFFSSIVSLEKNGGLSGYAAGCNFVDAFAQQLTQELCCAVKVMNWGHWRIGTGDAISNATKIRLQRSGIVPIETEEAMSALQTLLLSPLTQMVLVKTQRLEAMPFIDTRESLHIYPDNGESCLSASASLADDSTELINTLKRDGIFQNPDMEAKLLPLFAGILNAHGWLDDEQPTVASCYERWLATSKHLLHPKNYQTSQTLDDLWTEWHQAKTQWNTAAVSLVEACLHALPDILTGKQQATAVMFPNASMERVQGIYKDNSVADYFNNTLADRAVAAIQARLQENPNATIRILEIGAGTGGTTAKVLPKLAAYRAHIAEYCYTDVSKAFLFHAQEHFVHDYPFVVTQLFDVEKPLTNQNIHVGQYDIVIATNVLHATHNIRQTLTNTKALLRKSGILLLNEIVEHSLFAHLTFGLLLGWWLAEDEPLRIAGSPCLTSDTWQNVLQQQGFNAVLLPNQHAQVLGQQLMVAESNGIVCRASTSHQITDHSPVTVMTKTVIDTTELQEKSCQLLKKLVAKTLRMNSDELDANEPLETYGIDSILIVQITNHLREHFGDVSRTLLFECQTVAALTDYFMRHHQDRLLQLTGVKARVTETSALDTPVVTHEAENAPLNSSTLANEPIAVIGISCRFPQAETADDFWTLLKEGRDCVTEIPKERWDIDGFFHPDPDEAIAQGKSYSKWGAFLDNATHFDPQFFNISPKEAVTIDPQERLFLQATWAALEDAGYTRACLNKKFKQRVGVFAGITRTGFDLFGPPLWAQGSTLYPHTAFSSTANRVSYFLNLKGPSYAVDTMCSSSLTAIHQACQQLRLQECEIAIAGGVNLYLHSSSYVGLSASRMLSKDGRCKSFAKGGNGFVPGEGVGVVILKPLSKAIADKDNIYAVIRSTHVNHGGKTNGYTVPNPNAQAELIREALDKAQVNARTVSYIEAHGTGTELGDPIEITGLSQAFQHDTQDVSFCALGSVKTNFGHLEAAAGIAGFIKVILQMKHGQLVKSLHANETNPAIDFAKTPFVLQQQSSAWQRPVVEVKGIKQEYPRIAGVSSFGAGGVNAHVILEEYQSTALPVNSSEDYLLVLSAKNAERLQVYARQLLAFLTQHPDIDLADLAYTLQTGREAMEERLAFVASSYAEVVEKLQSFIDNTEQSDCFTGQINRHKEILAIFAHDPYMDKTIAAWMQQRNTSKLLNLWTKGLTIDWQQFYQTPVAQGYRMPKRISLPTYPFVNKAYWLPEPVVTTSAQVVVTQAERIISAPAVVTEPVTTQPALKPIEHQPATSKPNGLIELTALSNVSTQFTVPHTPQPRTLNPLPELHAPVVEQINTEPMKLDLQSHGQGVFSIILRNPNKHALALNSLSQGLQRCFNDISNLANTEDAPKVILLKGLDQLHIHDSAINSALQQLPQLIAGFDLPLIAVLQQNCTGIALLMAMLSDSVIADVEGQYAYRTHNTTFSQQEAHLFTARFGEKLGLQVLSSSETYTGKQLADLGCQWQFLPAPELNDYALHTAATIANKPRIALTELRKQLAAPFMALTQSLKQTLLPYTATAVKTDELSNLTPLNSNLGTAKTIPLDSEVVQLAAYENGVVVMTLADKSSKNTFSPAFVNGVIAAFDHVRQTDSYKVVVLTGYDTYFACGGTKEGLLAIQSGQSRFTDEQSYSLPLLCDIPVIAAMQGHGIGAGWAMGLFCDTAIYSEESSYQSPYMLYGFTPGAGSTLVFPQRLGYDLSHEVLLTAQSYKGSALKQRGLKNRVLPRAEVLAYALGLANRLALSPRATLIAEKEHRSRNLRQQLPNTFAQELTMHDKTFIGSQAVIDNIQQHFNDVMNAVKPPEHSHTPARIHYAHQANLTEIAQTLRATLCEELSMQADMVQDEQTFIDMGMDSISAVTWVRKINKHYDLALAATKIYSHPTLTLFAQHIFNELAQNAAPITQEPTHTSQQNDESDSADELLLMLRNSLAHELSLPLDSLDEETTFIDMGMDSISAVTWVRKINDRYHLAIGATKIYSHPNLRDFHRYVWQEGKQQGVFQTTKTAVPAPSAPPVVCCKPSVIIHSYELSAATPVKVTETEPESEPEPVIRSSTTPAPKTTQIDDKAIAVIGMSGRFPKASNIDEFWQNLVAGRDCVSEIPAERWKIDDFYSADKREAGKTVCRNMGAVDDADAFEPLFFNISPQEAELMDPQQRLFLQACWHSIEDAGYRPSQLSGLQCGVFAGCGTGDYSQGLDSDAPSAQVLMGETVAMLPARISYLLNLQGPSLAIDTACSSSLVAIATACDNLVLGNCDLALAGGVYVLAGPDIHIKMSQSGMLSPDGRCFTFDQRANGFVPGEGVGVLLLKRLSQAEQDGDDIYGVIRAWGVNQDGKTNGITAPNPIAQTRLEKSVYQRFNINPEHIELLEAHGTGTKLGDPIEVEALRETFSSFTNKKNYCALGSVKSNIGHLATAAGVSGVIKALLALQHHTLPPTINYQTLNEHIQLNNSAFYINTQCQAWQTPAHGQKRLAAVSSFGFSGTNAHFVLEEYTSTHSKPETSHQPVLIILSAKTPEQLQQYAQSLDQYLVQHPDSALTDMAYTLQTGRDAMPYRLAIIATDKQDLSHKLSNYSDNAECFTSVVETENRQVLASTERDLQTIAQHWLQGGTVDWSALTAPAHRLHGLPVYPFAKERYWLATVSKQAKAQPEIAPQTESWQVSALAKNIDWNQHLQHYQDAAISIIYEQEADKTTLEHLLTQMAQAAQLPKPLSLHFVQLDNLNCQTFQHPVDVVLMLADGQNDLGALKKLLTLLANKNYTPRLVGLFAHDLAFNELIQTLNQYDCTAISTTETLDSLAKVRTLLTEWLAIDDNADATGLVQVRYQTGQRLLLNQAFFHHFIHKNWHEKTLAPINVNTEYQRCVILVNQHSAKIAEQLTQFAPFANSIIIGDKHPPLIDYKSVESSKVCANNLLAQIEEVSLLIDLSDLYDTHRERDIDQLGKLSFYQALLRSYSPLNILYFTKGLQYFRNPKMTLAGAKFAGLIKMLSADYAHVKARFIDIDCPIYEQPHQLLSLIHQELHSDLQETEICYRQGQRFVPTLQLGQHGCAKPLTLSNDGVYIISGGTNGIGLALAQYLVEQGCKKLVLMGSQPLPDKAQWQTAITQPHLLSYEVSPALQTKLKVLNQLDKTLELRIYTGSLTDTHALTDYFQDIRQQLGVIKGVIHSAAVYSDASKPDFVSKNPNHSRQIQTVKVNGLEQLHELLQHEPLDFFVSFSSLAGVIPRLARGASDYAMANNFLEFFNAYQSQQKPETHYKTITFADWHETGALSRVNPDVLTSVQQTFKNIGLRTFSNKEGYQLFASALQHEGHWQFPAYLNRARFQSVAAQLLFAQQADNNIKQDLLSHLQQWEHEKQAGQIVPITRVTDIISFEEIKQLSPDLIHRIHQVLFNKETPNAAPASSTTPDDSTTVLINKTVCEVLKLSQLDPRKPFQNYGLDSISAMVVATRLEKQLQQDIQPRWLIDFSTVETLAAHLHSQKTKQH